MGWDFRPFGGLFQVSSGPRAAWANALLLSQGDTSYYDSLRALADAAWQNRRTDDRGQLYIPPLSQCDRLAWTHGRQCHGGYLRQHPRQHLPGHDEAG